MDENDAREQHHRDLIHKKIGDMSEKAQEQFAKVKFFHYILKSCLDFRAFAQSSLAE
jgi:hypothetical protein